MNLDALRQKILNQTTEVAVNGDKYLMSKLGAVDGLKINDLLASLEMEGDGDNRTVKRPEDMVRLYSAMISKSLVDENGAKCFDSDEGRSLLERLPRDEFMQLGEQAMNWNLGDAQKKTIGG